MFFFRCCLKKVWLKSIYSLPLPKYMVQWPHVLNSLNCSVNALGYLGMMRKICELNMSCMNACPCLKNEQETG
jgi:hypothetical protein